MSRDEDPATPTAERCVSSYPVRRRYRLGVIYPPEVPGLTGAIDIHVHAHEGQNDPLALAKLASQSGMGGLLYKTVGPISGGEYRPGRWIARMNADLRRWSDETGVEAVECWAGAGITDPARMYAAIREVGVEQVTLSSDGGEPLFPHCVECLRLVRGYMGAFGLSDEELQRVCVTNPGRVVGKAI